MQLAERTVDWEGAVSDIILNQCSFVQEIRFDSLFFPSKSYLRIEMRPCKLVSNR